MKSRDLLGKVQFREDLFSRVGKKSRNREIAMKFVPAKICTFKVVEKINDSKGVAKIYQNTGSNDPRSNLVKISHDPRSNLVEISHDPGPNLVEKVMTPF